MIRSTIDRRTAGPWRLLRLTLPLFAAGLCAGCGLAGTAVATGAGAEAEVQQVRTLKEQNAALEKALSGLRDSKTWKLAAPLWRLETHGRRKAARRERSKN